MDNREQPKKEMVFEWYQGDHYMGKGTIREMAEQQGVSYNRMCCLCTPSVQENMPLEKQWYKFPLEEKRYALYDVYKGNVLLAHGTAQEIAEELDVPKERVMVWSAPATLKRDKGNRIVAFRVDEEDGNEENQLPT